MSVKFWMDEQHIAAAKAAGSLPVMDVVPDCGLVVGDTVSFPGFRPMAFRVQSRHFRVGAEPGEPSWLLQIVPSETPF
ncbi:MAG TPA: hypothetical protein VN667_05895 [Burkholderiales bacterium]|nr:hypothetical protein [Burkholderiales bacterium]